MRYQIQATLAILIIILLCQCTNQNGYLKVKLNDFDQHTSLKFKTYYHDSTDCGEWGGHYETIIIHKYSGQLSIVYWRDSSECIMKSFKKPISNQICMEYKGVVTKAKSQWIKTYIADFNRHTTNPHIESNASDIYEISLTNGYVTKSISIEDNDGKWVKYEAFRNHLIDQ